jgi:hypothetical protein
MNILRPIQEEYYGDDHRWFFGTVINANPPAGLEGRVKVRINGVHSPRTEDIPEKDLPWAQVCLPTTEGGVSGYGRVPQLLAGSFVFGIFLDGKSSQIPLVLGSLPRTELPTSIQTGRQTVGNDKFKYSTERYQNVISFSFKDDNIREANLELRRMQCMKFFIDNGYSVIHSAAITGGIEGISQFVTYEENEESNEVEVPFTGIIRWIKNDQIGSRYAGLVRFANQYQPSSNWKRFSIQLQYILFELRNRFNLVNNQLKQTTDLESASKLFNKKYLFTNNDTVELVKNAYDKVVNDGE